MSELTHFDKEGNALMVDVSAKPITTRTAIATGKIFVCKEIFEQIQRHEIAKGDVLGVARLAGIMACKRTSELIPLCHPLPLSKCAVDFTLQEAQESDQDPTQHGHHRGRYYIEATCLVKTDGKTGVEMEALTAASVAALTVYDMCKAVQKDMTITDIRLLSKTGGVHGDYKREE